MNTYKRNHVIAMLLSLVMMFAMMPMIGQVYADDTDQQDLNSTTMTFDDHKPVVSGRTATVKYSKLKKNDQTLAADKVFRFTDKSDEELKFTLVSAETGAKTFIKYFKVNSATGKVTIKQGLKEGTYIVKVNIGPAGEDDADSYTQTVVFRIIVE